MRRVLPPEMWMSPEELEPKGVEGEGESYNHGLYPQRYKDMSIGPQDTWGWFKHLATTKSAEYEAVVFTDWRTICFTRVVQHQTMRK